jgi:hypothetical protein
MVDSIPAALRRASAGAAVIAAVLGALQYRVGIPANAPTSIAQHVSMATQASGGVVALALEPITGPLLVFEGKTGVLQEVPATQGRAYRAPNRALLLVGIGNMLLLMPILYLIIRSRQQRPAAVAAERAPA